MKTVFLTLEAAKQMIGKQFNWRAEGASENGRYFGTAIITAVNEGAKHPLIVDTVSGDDLSFAYLEDITLVPIEGTTGFRAEKATGNTRCFTYSDDYREVEIVESNPHRYTAIYDTDALQGVEYSFVRPDDESALAFVKANIKGRNLKLVRDDNRIINL